MRNRNEGLTMTKLDRLEEAVRMADFKLWCAEMKLKDYKTKTK